MHQLISFEADGQEFPMEIIDRNGGLRVSNWQRLWESVILRCFIPVCSNAVRSERELIL